MVFSFNSRAPLVDAMQSHDWDELRRLMSIARQQNLLGEALQAVEQSPLAPIPRAKPKAKSMAQAGSASGTSAQAGSASVTGGLGDDTVGGMTDASKRRAPTDDEDWEAIDGSLPAGLTTTADVARFLEANNALPVPWAPLDGNLAMPVVGEWYPEINYQDVDVEVPLPVGVSSGQQWGSTVITMAKFKGTTFEDLARTALGGNTESIKYCSWIKERFKKMISNQPKSQGPDFAAYLIFIKFSPPVVHPEGYFRTYRQGPAFQD